MNAPTTGRDLDAPDDASRGAEPDHALPVPSPFDPLEAARRERSVVLIVVRVVFGIVLLGVTTLRLLGVDSASSEGEKELLRLWYLTVALAVVLGMVSITIDLLTKRKKISTFTGVLTGVLLGLIATAAANILIDLLATTYVWYPAFASMFKVLVGTCLCYLGASIVLQTQDDFRLVIPYVEFAKQMRGVRPLVLDSSALIDGRFADIASTGLVQAPVVVPRFVVLELQTLADSADKLKRSRGRRGLEIVGRLQRNSRLDVSIDPKAVAGKGVDQMLVELSKQLDGMIVTTDTGLSRVAGIQGVAVLNLHDLALAVKPSLLPGEPLPVRIIKAGEQPGQGVGYLDDGTMVVVEDGREFIDEEVTASVISSLQTSAGRMIFARVNRLAAGDPARSSSFPGDRAALTNAPSPGPALPDTDAGGGGVPETPDEHELYDAADDPSAPPHDTNGPRSRPDGPFPPNAPRRPNRARNPRR